MNTAILIVTHGTFGSAMLAAAERMMGPQTRVASIDLLEGMGRQDLEAQIRLKRAEFGPCLLLVDMLGGTPWNAALASGLPVGDEVFAGLSLPLLLEALALRESLDAHALGKAMVSKASQSVVLASVLLGGESV